MEYLDGEVLADRLSRGPMLPSEWAPLALQMIDGRTRTRPVNAALEEARDKPRDHFRARAAEKIKDYVQGWKDEHAYPYEEEPQTSVEEVQRKVFDIVAVSVATALPEIQTSEHRTRRFQLRMLRQAIELPGRSARNWRSFFRDVAHQNHQRRIARRRPAGMSGRARGHALPA